MADLASYINIDLNADFQILANLMDRLPSPQTTTKPYTIRLEKGRIIVKQQYVTSYTNAVL